MPIYTILGGTGSTGSAVIRALLASPKPDLSIRIFVRSKSKLLNLLPELSTHPNTTITEGSLNSQSDLSKCLSGSDAIFSCIATNDSAPETTIAVDTAASIISALRLIRSTSGETYKSPLVLVLTSASVNDSLQDKPPQPVKALLERALWYLYEDLRKAQALYLSLREDDPGLLDAIFVQPPAIMPGTVPTGHEISTVRGGSVVSFADVGAGMVEMAGKRGELKWKGSFVAGYGCVLFANDLEVG
ncbi:hypothetical protein HYFRA_00005650 [Hymenoscyphus fraxineus]|uniref:NAD(P)-binding domain-containing protein n=1 Tax=Hymenoscyphus fraxineus TaxID=746836 RepID=A0A9N9PM24_9HELO|nr:hypothetical protein HYFRA_00005650 [Hymenoscyphus fraxineus]